MIPIRGLRAKVEERVKEEAPPQRAVEPEFGDRPGTGSIDWTPERESTLRKRWNEGATTSVIAAELGSPGATNSVIGKAHRLGLPRRANPVKRLYEGSRA